VPVLGVVLALALFSAPGCSIKKMAIGSLADTLAASGDTFAADDDPELIRLAVPFSLKTIESLIAEVPDHPGLLLAACSGFTQYSYAFIQTDAEYEEPGDFEKSQETRLRARRMYQRATRYCLRRLELTYPGIEEALRRDPGAVLAKAKRDDVPALYWTAAAWGSAISLGLDQPELIADLPATRALMERALALDESWSQGAIHAAMISIESVPEAMGGSTKRAREHFARAVELSGGHSAGPYVTLAASVSQPAQDRAEFERLLNQALAIDADQHPGWRLANLVTQKKARFLLSRVDALFNEPEAPPAAASLAGFGAAGVGLVPRASTWLRVEGPRSGGSSWSH
jgi:predicted anti-sigma-YlaC factor YlaD